jgi:hypothetical protein
VSYRWIVGLLVSAAAFASMISACGDGDEASADATKAQFTKEAKAVCAESKKDWDAAIKAYNRKFGLSSQEQERAQAEKLVDDSLVPILRTELKALEDLDAPEGDAEKIEKMLESRSQSIEELEDKGARGLFGAPFQAFEKETEAYGFDCSLQL